MRSSWRKTCRCEQSSNRRVGYPQQTAVRVADPRVLADRIAVNSCAGCDRVSSFAGLDSRCGQRQEATVKFVLEINLADMALDGEAGQELGRILRYWGGAMRQVELKPGSGSAIYDSAYREVGRWIVTDSPDATT
jgi:hypothetical protein